MMFQNFVEFMGEGVSLDYKTVTLCDEVANGRNTHAGRFKRQSELHGVLVPR